MQTLHALQKKYAVDSVSLARLCYKMERHIRAVKPAVDVLVAKGLLEAHHQGDKISYAISDKGIEFVEYKGLVQIRNWVVEG